MYVELGGYVGYQLTPVRELQECRASILAEIKVQAEHDREQRRKQEELGRKLKQQEMRNR
jgi:hypothetical protein